MIKTAVFGGSFDPVHIEHINIAKACVKELGIERLIVLPTENPPHKRAAETPFGFRAEMAGIAFSEVAAEIIVDETERENDGVNYSAENLPKLKKKYGDFVFVIGGDSLDAIESWKNPEFIVRNFQIAVFNRTGYPDAQKKADELNEKWHGDIKVMKYVGKAVDSHGIRDRLYLQERADGVPPKVKEYINSHNLYSRFDGYISKAKGFLDEKRFVHSKNTALAALELNRAHKLGVDYDKVLLAGLLHDVGKKFDKTPLSCDMKDIPADSLGTPVQHQFVSAVIVRDDFHITDDEILNAIRYHTTGRENMSVLEKIVYCADLVSSERDFDGVAELRAALAYDFGSGFLKCLTYSRDYVLKTGRTVYPLTDKAIKYYKEKL